MNRRWMSLIACPALALSVIALRGDAQPTQVTQPTTQPDDRRPDDDRGPREDRERRHGEWGEDRGPRGPRGPFGERSGSLRGPGGMERRMPSMDVMRGFLELVDRYTELSSNPDAAGISAVLAANDLYRAQGSDAAIAYFTLKLEQVKRPAIQRAIRLQLIDLYRAAGKTEQALEQLEVLMMAPRD